MSRYEVATFDVCVQGFERLRSQSEFILVAHVDATSTWQDVRAEWLGDVQSCDRFDGFDYEAAAAAVNAFCAANAGRYRGENPFNLELPAEAECEGEGDSCMAFLYINVTEDAKV